MKARWRDRTDAEILTEAQFITLKERSEWHLVGVLGFAGKWERSLLEGEELTRFIADAREALDGELARVQEQFAERLIVCTGATKTGVLELTYEICAERNIATMSVAPEAALKYELGQLRYLIPCGKDFGDESGLFVQLCDEFVLLGGGKQSEREAWSAYKARKPVTIVQGFGGIADELEPRDFPADRLVRFA